MSCLRLGLMYRLGQGITPDEIKSSALIEQACEMGLATACELRGEAGPSPAEQP